MEGGQTASGRPTAGRMAMGGHKLPPRAWSDNPREECGHQGTSQTEHGTCGCRKNVVRRANGQQVPGRRRSIGYRLRLSSPDQRQDRTVSPVMQRAGEPPRVGDAGGTGGRDRPLRRLVQHRTLPRGPWQRHAGRCILRLTGTHLEPSARTQRKDAGASPASEPWNARTERNRPDRKTPTCADGLIVPFLLTIYNNPLARREPYVHRLWHLCGT